MARNWPLGVVLLFYFVVGAWFAIRIPAWQTPDEPAHYNYTRQLALRGQFPIIELGDYDPALVPIPPDDRTRPVDKIEYEDHQPPLFYALSVPVFVAANGSLLALRLLALSFGAITVACAYFIVQTLFDRNKDPRITSIAAFSAAFVALLPQHLHIMAGYNNDSLSEALLALTTLLGVRVIMSPRANRWQTLALGVAVGLSLETKAQAYLALPLAGLALLLAQLPPTPKPWRAQLVAALASVRQWWGLGIAIIIAAPWWLRNMQTYGGFDLLGLGRHNEIVIGQPTTAQWVAQKGLNGWLLDLFQITFQSYWAQFGWMSIVIDRRFYLVFLAFTLISTILFFVWWAQRKNAVNTSRGLTLLAALGAMTVLAFVWYNLQFVQFQGRYLYPALIPLAVAFALGWHQALRRFGAQRWLWFALLLGFAVLDLYLLLRVILPGMKG